MGKKQETEGNGKDGEEMKKGKEVIEISREEKRDSIGRYVGKEEES